MKVHNEIIIIAALVGWLVCFREFNFKRVFFLLFEIVLSDPHKRAVYDSVGVKGLKKNVWQLINRTKTPQEIREEYERLEKENKAKLFRLNELANSQVDTKRLLKFSKSLEN
jgi:hypothetical protein